MEKGVKQGKSSYPLLSMKKDQANKTNVERVYTVDGGPWCGNQVQTGPVLIHS